MRSRRDRFGAADLARRVEARSHPGQRRRPRGRAGDPRPARDRPSGRRGVRRGVRRRGHRPAALGHRPDRRHQELRARRAGLGDADRPARRRRRRSSAWCRRPRWAGAGGPHRARAPGRTALGAPPRRLAVSRRRRHRRREPVLLLAVRLGRDRPSRPVPGADRRVLAHPRATATSGPTCSSPKAPSTSPPNPNCRCGTWPRSRRSSSRPAAGSPGSTGRTACTRGNAAASNGLLHEALLSLVGDVRASGQQQAAVAELVPAVPLALRLGVRAARRGRHRRQPRAGAGARHPARATR